MGVRKPGRSSCAVAMRSILLQILKTDRALDRRPKTGCARAYGEIVALDAEQRPQEKQAPFATMPTGTGRVAAYGSRKGAGESNK